MATIYDIAKKTGFSITTVSKVLNNYSDVSEKTRKIILDAVNELEYYPSSSARTLTTKKILDHWCCVYRDIWNGAPIF